MKRKTLLKIDESCFCSPACRKKRNKMALLASHAQCRDLVISGRPDPCVLLELDEGLLVEVLRDGCVFI